MLIETVIEMQKNSNGAAKAISTFILNYEKDYVELTASEIARNSYVTNAYVTKYIKRLGFKSFQEFKNQLLKEAINRHTFSDHQFAKALDNYTNDMLYTYTVSSKVMNVDDIKTLSFEMLSSKNIYLIGIGSNSTVAFDLHLKLINNRINCQFLQDIHLQKYMSTFAKKGDVFVVFSYGGGSPQLDDFMGEAYNNGAYTALVSTKGIDKNIYNMQIKIDSNENLSNTHYIQARNALLMVSDMIYTNILVKLQRDN